jgi:hypothetical protein
MAHGGLIYFVLEFNVRDLKSFRSPFCLVEVEHNARSSESTLADENSSGRSP